MRVLKTGTELCLPAVQHSPPELSDIAFACVPRENDITPVLDHTFCVEHNAFGRILQHELKPNGRNVPVTEENKKEYVR